MDVNGSQLLGRQRKIERRQASAAINFRDQRGHKTGLRHLVVEGPGRKKAVFGLGNPRDDPCDLAQYLAAKRHGRRPAGRVVPDSA